MMFDALKSMLANHIEGSLIAQGYHWNAEGINFAQYHDLFSEIYSDWYAQADVLAEYIRILSSANEYVNPSMEILILNKTIKSKVLVGDRALEMCAALIVINDEFKKQFNLLFDLASDENEQGLADYCSTRLDSANKLNWKLVAITKGK